MSELSRSKSVETVGISEARFNDLLVPEHEQYWQEFTEALKGSVKPVEVRIDTLLAIWEDSETPQVFRDRAMLELIQSSCVFEDPQGISVDSWDRIYRVLTFTPEQTAARDQWYFDVLQYSLATGEHVLGQTRELFLAFDFYGRGDLDRTTFETVLDGLDIYPSRFVEVYTPYEYKDEKIPRIVKDHGALPAYSRDDVQRGYGLIEWRFPLVDDIFSGVLGTEGDRDALMDWGREQLDLWLQFKEGRVVADELPSWLSWAGENDDTRAFFIELRRTRAGYESIGWDFYQRAVKLFGWSALDPALDIPLERSGVIAFLRIRKNFMHVVDLAKEIPIQEFSDDLILHYLEMYYDEKSRLSKLNDATKDHLGYTPAEQLEKLFSLGGDNTMAFLLDIQERLSYDTKLYEYTQRAIKDLSVIKRDQKRENQERESEVRERAVKQQQERTQRNAREAEAAGKLGSLISGLRSINH